MFAPSETRNPLDVDFSMYETCVSYWRNLEYACRPIRTFFIRRSENRRDQDCAKNTHLTASSSVWKTGSCTIAVKSMEKPLSHLCHVRRLPTTRHGIQEIVFN